MAISPAAALDCSKARSEAEKTICSDPDLKEEDAAMEKAYFSLHKKLGPVGQKKLLAMQRQWLKTRNEMSVDSIISGATEDHTRLLEKTPPGMVPFHTETTSKSGKVKTTITGYKFPTTNTALHKTFNALFDKRYKENQVEPADKADEEVDATDVSRFGPYIISSRIYTDGYYGGAHPLHFAVQVNVDVKTAKPLKIESLFSREALDKLALSCASQIAEFRGMYEQDTPEKTLKAINEDYPGEILKHLKDPGSWLFKKAEAIIVFNEYTIAPYAAGEQNCSFKNKVLARLSKKPDYFQTPEGAKTEED